MKLKERIFHAVLFELGAITVSSVAVLLVGGVSTESAVGVSVMIATVAMLWNFVFNAIFDKFFTGKREERGLGLRLFHTVAFEGGLLLFTIPFIAYLLDLSLWQAFIADIGLTLLIMLYALIFNWAYDIIRVRFFIKNP